MDPYPATSFEEAPIPLAACESCGREADPVTGHIRHRSTVPFPGLDAIQEQEWDAGTCDATDGCTVEPDGTCEHGHRSWMLVMGVI